MDRLERTRVAANSTTPTIESPATGAITVWAANPMCSGGQRHVRRLDGRSSVVITPYHSQCKRERPRHMLLTEAALLAGWSIVAEAGRYRTGRPGGRSPLVAANGLPGRRQEAAPEATGPSMDGRPPGQAVGRGATSRRAGRALRRALPRRRRASTARCRCPSRRRCRRGR